MTETVLEQKKYQIKYTDFEGITRNYYADFIVNDALLVECKPKKLHKSINVVAKKKAAIKFCKLHNLTYQLIDAGRLQSAQIKDLYNNGLIKWLPRYQIKYEERYESPSK